MNNKQITIEFLQEKGFKIQKDESYQLEVENMAFHSVFIRVEMISPAVGEFVSIKIGKDYRYAMLPIGSDVKLNKLIEALKGK